MTGLSPRSWRRLLGGLLSLSFALVSCADARAPAAGVVVTGPAPAPPLEIAPSSPAGATSPPPFVLALSPTAICVVSRGKLLCRSPRSGAAQIEPVDDVTSASFGEEFHCLTRREGRVACAGSNHFGQLGAGLAAPTSPLVNLPGLTGALRVVTGPNSACAILQDGRLACWGRNEDGEAASDTNVLPDARELVEPEVVAGLRGVADVALTARSGCATTAAGQTFCWGSPLLAEPGSPLPGRGHAKPPAPIPALAGVTSLTASDDDTFCGIRSGKVVCWGETRLLLSAPRGTLSEVPLADARAVSLGHRHGCALTGSGEVHCFGAAYTGALGTEQGPRDATRPPTKVPGLPSVAEIVCRGMVSCARTRTNEVYCWGRLGPGIEPISPPTKIQIPPAF